MLPPAPPSAFAPGAGALLCLAALLVSGEAVWAAATVILVADAAREVLRGRWPPAETNRYVRVDVDDARPVEIVHVGTVNLTKDAVVRVRAA